MAGTLVHTPEGLKPIESLAIGDQVLSQPEMTGEVALRRVKTLFHFDDKSVLQIAWQTADGQTETLTATPNHPFWVVGEGWTTDGYKPIIHQDDGSVVINGKIIAAPNRADDGRLAVPEGMTLLNLIRGDDGRWTHLWRPDSYALVDGELDWQGPHENRVVFSTDGPRNIAYSQYMDDGGVYDLFLDLDTGRYAASQAAALMGLQSLNHGLGTVNYGTQTTVDEIVVVGNRPWTPLRGLDTVIDYTGAGLMGILNGGVVEPGIGTAELIGSGANMLWDYGISIFSPDAGAVSRADQRNAQRWGSVKDTLISTAIFAIRYNTDFDGSFRRELTRTWLDRVSNGPEGLYNAMSDVTSVATAFIPASKAGQLSKISKLTKVAGMSDEAVIAGARIVETRGIDLIARRPSILSDFSLSAGDLAYLQRQLARKEAAILRASNRGELVFFTRNRRDPHLISSNCLQECRRGPLRTYVWKSARPESA